MLCLLDLLLQNKNGMECFSFPEIWLHYPELDIIEPICSNQNNPFCTYVFSLPLTLDTASWKVSHVLLEGPGNTEKQPFSIAVTYPLKQMLTVKRGSMAWAVVHWQINVTVVGGCLSVPWSQRRSIGEKSIRKVARKHQWGLRDRDIQPGYESTYIKETDWWGEHTENADYSEVTETEKMEILIIAGHGPFSDEWHERRILFQYSI